MRGRSLEYNLVMDAEVARNDAEIQGQSNVPSLWRTGQVERSGPTSPAISSRFFAVNG